MECYHCHNFSTDDAKQLAIHINQVHPNKKRGWATKVIMDVQRLDRKVSDKFTGRIPYTEEQKESREQCVRPTSGIERIVLCCCPNCKLSYQVRLAKEFIEDDGVWKIGGKIPIVCESCKPNKKGKW